MNFTYGIKNGQPFIEVSKGFEDYLHDAFAVIGSYFAGFIIGRVIIHVTSKSD